MMHLNLVFRLIKIKEVHFLEHSVKKHLKSLKLILILYSKASVTTKKKELLGVCIGKLVEILKEK